MFIDYTQIDISAGNGGSGAVSFRREKFIPKGGPDGGDGGRGGHVIFKVDTNLHTLQDIRYRRRYKAENGHPGRGSNKTGKNGKDVVILVPAGSVIRKKGSKDIIIDLTVNGQNYIICNGGQGGKGNARFKTSTKQAPRKAQPGIEGESGIFEIELKVLADVGLVGLPNAGKSTLLSSISSARPKVADYPFTTLKPNLGIVKYGEYESFVMADIPGLIEGASLGKGLGHQFLRHIERNRIHIYLIDCMEDNPYDVYNTLKNELKNFNEDLIKKPSLICRTKSDLKQELSPQWSDFNEKIYDISSLTKEGVDQLIHSLVEVLNNN
ncbi:GTPase Obg [bacterium]|nr:MAG: GTPase Obg [bacterium]